MDVVESPLPHILEVIGIPSDISLNDLDSEKNETNNALVNEVKNLFVALRNAGATLKHFNRIVYPSNSNNIPTSPTSSSTLPPPTTTMTTSSTTPPTTAPPTTTTTTTTTLITSTSTPLNIVETTPHNISHSSPLSATQKPIKVRTTIAVFKTSLVAKETMEKLNATLKTLQLRPYTVKTQGNSFSLLSPFMDLIFTLTHIHIDSYLQREVWHIILR
jgi:hypothetical protein